MLDVGWTYAEGSALYLPCGFELRRFRSPMLKDKVSSTASAHLGGRCKWTIIPPLETMHTLYGYVSLFLFEQ